MPLNKGVSRSRYTGRSSKERKTGKKKERTRKLRKTNRSPNASQQKGVSRKLDRDKIEMHAGKVQEQTQIITSCHDDYIYQRPGNVYCCFSCLSILTPQWLQITNKDPNLSCTPHIHDPQSKNCKYNVLTA